jgi:hypothetical protein
MSSRRSAPRAPEGPYETRTSVGSMRERLLCLSAGAPIRDINSVGRRKVPRPAVAALRMTSGLIFGLLLVPLLCVRCLWAICPDFSRLILFPSSSSSESDLHLRLVSLEVITPTTGANPGSSRVTCIAPAQDVPHRHSRRCVHGSARCLELRGCTSGLHFRP